MKWSNDHFSERMFFCKHIGKIYKLHLGNSQIERNISSVVKKDETWELQRFVKSDLAFSHFTYEF